MVINSISDFRKAVRNGPYAWPGGYPCFFVMTDGAAVSFKALKRRGTLRCMLEALRDKDNSGWRPIAVEINYEDNDLFCADTGERIESAYGD